MDAVPPRHGLTLVDAGYTSGRSAAVRGDEGLDGHAIRR
jgi:hypothetical protein